MLGEQVPGGWAVGSNGGAGGSSTVTRTARARSVSGFAEGTSIDGLEEPAAPTRSQRPPDQLAGCPTQEENTGIPRQVLPGPDWLPDPTASTA